MMVSNIFRPLYVTLTFSHKNQQITTHLVLVSVMGCYRKKQTGGKMLRAHVFKKDPWKFQISHFTLGNSRQNEASTPEIPQNCVTPTGISKTKSQNLWNFYTTFSGSLLKIPHSIFGNSMSSNLLFGFFLGQPNFEIRSAFKERLQKAHNFFNSVK